MSKFERYYRKKAVYRVIITTIVLFVLFFFTALRVKTSVNIAYLLVYVGIVLVYPFLIASTLALLMPESKYKMIIIVSIQIILSIANLIIGVYTNYLENIIKI